MKIIILSLLFCFAASAQVVFEHEINKTRITIYGTSRVVIQTDYIAENGKEISSKEKQVLTRFDKSFSDYVKVELPELTEKDKKELKYLLDLQQEKCLKYALTNKVLVGYLKNEKLAWDFSKTSDKNIEKEVKDIFKRSDIWDFKWDIDSKIIGPGTLEEEYNDDNKKN